LALLLALRYLSPGPRSREECRNAGATRADTLGQRALRIELNLEFTREILLRKRLVLANIGRDHLLYLPAVEQNAEADPVDTAIVGDDGEVLHARVADRQNELLGNPAKPESTGHDRHAVLQKPSKRGAGIGIDFLHALSCFENGPTQRRAIHDGGRRNFLACGCEACNLSAQRARRRPRQQGDLGDEFLDDSAAERVEVLGDEDERARTANDVVLVIFFEATRRV